MLALLKYNYKLYKKCEKMLLPLIAFIVFMQVNYGVKPLFFKQCMAASITAMFLIMAWVGSVYMDNQDNHTEQIVYLKVRNSNLYWSSKVVFLLIINIIFTLINTFLPLILGKYEDKTTIFIVFVSIIAQVISGAMGMLIGMIFKSKIIISKNLASILIILVLLLSVIKGPINNEIFFMKYITWILPPVFDLGTIFDSNIVYLLLGGVVYVIIELFIYLRIMKRNLF